jgi:hypothetical protein
VAGFDAALAAHPGDGVVRSFASLLVEEQDRSGSVWRSHVSVRAGL